jgi:hypothetical protein
VQGFQQQPGFAFAGLGTAVAGGLQPDQHTVTEPLEQVVFDRGVDHVVAGVAGQVRLVDQTPQRVGDLGGPVLVGIHLAGTGEIAAHRS